MDKEDIRFEEQIKICDEQMDRVIIDIDPEEDFNDQIDIEEIAVCLRRNQICRKSKCPDME